MARAGSASIPGSLPRNVTDGTLVECRLPGRTLGPEPASPVVASWPVEDGLFMRPFRSWRQKRNYEGDYWSYRAPAHVGYESLLERDSLIWLDFQPDTVSVAAQPLAFLWPLSGGKAGPRDHVVDYFVRRADGSGLVVDVRASGMRDGRFAAQSDLTRAACELIGWDYTVLDGLPEDSAVNAAGSLATARTGAAPTRPPKR
ncbi:MAG: TnsA-like heteromeric transposase endonuclease subunit [Candidatus Lutibacillus vidarii]|nr:TnsA-like heteromeric transposase endonuclease subunit [Candidatus Lutibacillus vidarii]